MFRKINILLKTSVDNPVNSGNLLTSFFMQKITAQKSERKSKMVLNENKCKSGVDGMNLDLILTLEDVKRLEPRKLFNLATGNEYGEIKIVNRQAKLYLNLPKFIRTNNVESFKLTDSIAIDMIKEDVLKQLLSLFGESIKTKCKAIEVNITHVTSGKATTHDVLNLLHIAHLNQNHDNMLFIAESRKNRFKGEINTVMSNRQRYYKLKAYSKEVEQKRTDNLNVAENLLRFEIILQERVLNHMFPKREGKDQLEHILTKESLLNIVHAFKVIYQQIIDEKVKPALTGITDMLFNSLVDTGSVTETICELKEIIIDIECLKRAIIKWNKTRNVINGHLSHDIKTYIERYSLPQDTIVTLKDLKELCG